MGNIAFAASLGYWIKPRNLAEAKASAILSAFMKRANILVEQVPRHLSLVQQQERQEERRVREAHRSLLGMG